MNATKQRLVLTAAILGALVCMGIASLLITIPTCHDIVQTALLTTTAFLFGNIPLEIKVTLTLYATPILVGPLTALVVGLIWFIVARFEKPVSHRFYCSALAIAFIVSDGLFMNRIPCVLAALLGGCGCIGGILLYRFLAKKMPAVFNRETVSYIVFGVLTTVVSFVSQMLFASLGTPAFINTIGSWICAVAFAYVVNKLFVFCSHTATFQAFLRELWLFVAARLASLAMELVFMVITVDLLHFSEAICKIIAQVFILVANYIFSKLIIFKKSE